MSVRPGPAPVLPHPACPARSAGPSGDPPLPSAPSVPLVGLPGRAVPPPLLAAGTGCPVPAGRLVAATYLTALRRRRGLRVEDVCQAIGLRTGHIEAVESAQTRLDPITAQRLMDLYRLPDPAERAGVLVRLSGEPGGDVVRDEDARWPERLAAIEAAAGRITVCSGRHIPPLLRSPLCTHVLARTGTTEHPQAATRPLTDGHARVTAVLCGSVLTRGLPGAAGHAVMAQQLEHLIDLVDSGRVEIRIVPQRRLLPLPYGSLTEIGGDRTLYAEETTIGVAYSAGPGSRHARQTISTALRHACSISESLTLLEQARALNTSSASSR